ncbi:rhamnan synthesis F family protein [Pararhodobacter zhoushanensis]|uniref:Rhamnan synthesis F family protein n=1 Tax=Pararhodobacter zhoushanensis TaxID=2479545 RepID=A0ABT3GVE9_9RHOB|nr:rhamnan synthesis F family protein [Pararhodobacter zhoushanensis]MCW1931526.1 rhamnan synthesis F family protein [Pararhodobacter zhoushanensis]
MQAIQFPWFFVAAPLRSAHDARKHKTLTLTQGMRALQKDVAVVLIFQPRGLQESTLHMLDHLYAKGFAPLVVSNAPITSQDLNRLKDHAYLVMQRPNYGYDFGGYRDAILHLLEQKIPMRFLVVINDSIWFPLSNDCTLLDHARAADKDLFGYYYNKQSEVDQRAHLQSYFYCFGPRLVSHTDFAEYWRKLFVTSNKNLVIRRGEMRLTAAFQAKGHSIGYCHDIADLKTALKSLSNAELKQVVAYQMQVDTKNSARLGRYRDADPDAPGWRDTILGLIDQEKMGKYFLIAHPLVLLGKLHAPMLKKDRQPMYQLQRAELLASDIVDEISPTMRAAIEGWDQPE